MNAWFVKISKAIFPSHFISYGVQLLRRLVLFTTIFNLSNLFFHYKDVEILLGKWIDNRSLLSQYEKRISLSEDARSVFVFMSITLTQCHAFDAWCWNLRGILIHSLSEGFLGIYGVTFMLKTRKIHRHEPALLSPNHA